MRNQYKDKLNMKLQSLKDLHLQSLAKKCHLHHQEDDFDQVIKWIYRFFEWIELFFIPLIKNDKVNNFWFVNNSNIKSIFIV